MRACALDLHPKRVHHFDSYLVTSMLSARRGALAAARSVQLARRGMASQVPAPLPPRDPQLGDYPNLPREFAQTRDPYGDERGHWWDMQNRRHFNEPVR